uniref:Uncharacterized protein n=1 Tax=Anguilla anguilla TaxID=7936 RepID=A0A0E9P719_ANGAN
MTEYKILVVKKYFYKQPSKCYYPVGHAWGI